MGHSHVSDFVEKVSKDSFYKDDDDYWHERYLQSIKEIDSSDVCILETSIPSTAMGQLAQLSIEKFKPTILLYKGNKPFFFRGLAETEKRVQLLEYDLDNLPKVLEYAFEFAEEFINTRFTLLFPPDIVSHLKEIKKQGLSQSDYIRNLIRKDMKK